MPFDKSKLAAFVKNKKAAGARTGGKGTARRKPKKAFVVKHDDKRLKTVLNKLNVRDIAAIEEVNLFKDDGKVIHFAAPKVQACIPANTYVVSGLAEEKELKDLLPGIISQLGPDNLNDLRKIYASFSQDDAKGADDMPELVGNFEDVSNGDDGDDMPELVEG
jgi:nascent polypeptide-associated complex subunit beta